MRAILLMSVTVLAFGCGTHNTSQSPPAVPSTVLRSPDERNVFCFIDGRTMSCDALQSHDPETIDRIDVLKGEAAADRFGPSAEGAIVITSRLSLAPGRQETDLSDRIFYFIDGRTASLADFRSFSQETIERIDVLKNTAAIARFGPEARTGAILVTTKPSR